VVEGWLPKPRFMGGGRGNSVDTRVSVVEGWLPKPCGGAELRQPLASRSPTTPASSNDVHASWAEGEETQSIRESQWSKAGCQSPVEVRSCVSHSLHDRQRRRRAQTTYTLHGRRARKLSRYESLSGRRLVAKATLHGRRARKLSRYEGLSGRRLVAELQGKEERVDRSAGGSSRFDSQAGLTPRSTRPSLAF